MSFLSAETEIDTEEDARVESNALFLTDKEFNEFIRTGNGLETTKETTDDEILERVMSKMHGNETVNVDEDDEDDEDISVSDLEAKSAIETLKKYLRQNEDSEKWTYLLKQKP